MMMADVQYEWWGRKLAHTRILLPLLLFPHFFFIIFFLCSLFSCCLAFLIGVRLFECLSLSLFPHAPISFKKKYFSLLLVLFNLPSRDDQNR